MISFVYSIWNIESLVGMKVSWLEDEQDGTSLFVYLCVPVVVRLSSEWDVSGHEPKSNNIKCCC